MGDWYIGPNGRWTYDPNAPGPSPDPTRAHPVVPREAPRAGDIGDWIDPNAEDPTPDEVRDEDDPNFVRPWFGPVTR
jgi:hypothetical protein